MPPKEPKKEVEVLGVVEQTVPKPTTTRSRSEARGSFGGQGGSEAGGGYGGNRSEAGGDLAVWEEEQEDDRWFRPLCAWRSHVASLALPEAACPCTFQPLIEELTSWLTMDSRGIEHPRIFEPCFTQVKELLLEGVYERWQQLLE